MTTTNLHLVPVLRMGGAVVPSEDNGTFTFTYSFRICVCANIYVLLVSLVLVLVSAPAEGLRRSSVHAVFVTAVCCVSPG